MRVNARLDEESQRQIDYLTQTTGMPVSHVLRESVGHYYRQVRSQRAGPKQLLALVGKGQSGRSDIASDVKAGLSEALAEKHRPGPSSALETIAPPRKSATVKSPGVKSTGAKLATASKPVGARRSPRK